MPAFHLGQLVMVNIEGTRLDAPTANFLRQHHIRGVCLFRKNLADAASVRQLTADLRAVMGDGALIGIDQEGGSVLRALFVPQAPSAMALGACGDEALAYAVGAAVARGLRSLGVNWNFAPVLDVNNNPANPVIAQRSFSSDPQTVARFGGAWLRGALSEGVACCVKHFPGHGDTHTDSHYALPQVDKTLAQLQALELVPFAALAHEAPAIMSAHILYPLLDAQYPATLSRYWLTDVLRQQMGFAGVVITDSLMMQAVRARFGVAGAAVLALQAGADMVLAQGSIAEQIATLDAMAAALHSGDLQLLALQQSCARLDALAQHYPSVVSDYPADMVAADDALMHRASAQALTRVAAHTTNGASDLPLPPALHTPVRVITQADVAGTGVSEAGLNLAQVRALFQDFSDVAYLALPDLSALNASHTAPASTTPQDARYTVLVSTHALRYGSAAAHAQVDLHITLRNPFQVLDIAAPALVSWGYTEGALQAVRGWLQGTVSADGVAPVELHTAPR